MLYADTSVLVAYYAPEALSEDAERLLRLFPQAAISDLVEVELFSAVARKVRQRELGERDAERIRGRFLSHLAGGFFDRLALDREHYQLARHWLGSSELALRSLDALHLAVASVEDRTLATADTGLAKAAMVLGLTAMLVEEGSTSTVHEG